MRYPYEINGVVQEQNRLKRAFIWIWYSGKFRVIFILFNFWWLLPLMLWLYSLGLDIQAVKCIAFLLHMSLFMMGCIFNDFSNLRKIGLDEYRNSLIETDDNHRDEEDET